jgi:hypothetical protein
LKSGKIDKPAATFRRELNRIADEQGRPFAEVLAEFKQYGKDYEEESNNLEAMRKAAEAAGMPLKQYKALWHSGSNEGGEA